MKKTKLVGAYYKPKYNHWVAKIIHNNREVYIGCYKTEIEAAIAYDAYVIEHKLNRRINFPIEPPITIPNTRWIYSTLNKWALVDDYNYEWLNQYKWHTMLNRKTYYFLTLILVGDKIVNTFMHNLVTGEIEEGKQVDHRDRNGWNNMDTNMRVCTLYENAINKAAISGCSSKFKGVHKKKNRWIARLGTKQIGSFKVEKEAASAYNKKVKEKYKEFAWLNKDENGNIL